MNQVPTVTDSIISNDGQHRRINKIVYVVVTFFLGFLGVHRFMRGQVGVGVAMLLLSWLTAGIWPFIEFIISLVKLGDNVGPDFIFTLDGRFTTA